MEKNKYETMYAMNNAYVIFVRSRRSVWAQSHFFYFLYELLLPNVILSQNNSPINNNT